MSSCKQVFFTALSIFFVIHASLSQTYAADVCEMVFTDCPENFHNDTIEVPESVIALSSSIQACGSQLSSPGDSSKLPSSIMFVIDHSGSMTGEGSGPNDRMGSRFTVTMALLDSIYKVQPNAEVGIAIFGGLLYFDKTSTQYFSSYFSTFSQTYDSQPNQAYLQLLKLNGDYNGKKGIDIIKDVLETDTVVGQRNTYVDLVYKPNFDPTFYTNINIGFTAAKDAMRSAANPPERQFVIFLSDGEPMGNNQAGLPSNDFVNGTNMPATFTVYFTSNSTAPRSLVTMTGNIRTNGYSSSNPSSDLWAIQTNHSALLNLLMENVFNNILISGDPQRMVVNGIQSVDFADNSFVFTDRFPLQGDLTQFTTSSSYRYTDPQTNAVRDTSIAINFTVKRVKGASVPSGVSLNCWAQPALQFYYDGVPISAISEEMQQVQIRLTPNDETLTAAVVGISSSLESENFNLTQSGMVWSAPVGRVIATKATANDKIMQHISGDSLIAVYRNPKLPLDSVRVAIPIVDNAGPELEKAIYYPGNNGAPDTIRVLFDEPVQCNALLNAIPGASFVYVDSGKVSSSKLDGASFAQSCQSDLIQEARFTLRAGMVVPLEDSMSLVGLSASVKDRSGNSPSRNNPRVPIEWGTANTISVVVSENPFTPGKSEIPVAVRERYAGVIGDRTHGVLVAIKSLKPLEEQKKSFGSAKIYDAVGNLIVNRMEVGKSTQSGEYGVFWEGKNENNRLVGAGTYLMRLNLKDLDGRVTNLNVKIGIQRGNK